MASVELLIIVRVAVIAVDTNEDVCTDPNNPIAPGLPNQPWTDTTCNWLWLPEWERNPGPPRSFARWDGGTKFAREFERLTVSVDCDGLEVSMSCPNPRPRSAPHSNKSSCAQVNMTWHSQTSLKTDEAEIVEIGTHVLVDGVGLDSERTNASARLHRPRKDPANPIMRKLPRYRWKPSGLHSSLKMAAMSLWAGEDRPWEDRMQ